MSDYDANAHIPDDFLTLLFLLKKFCPNKYHKILKVIPFCYG